MSNNTAQATAEINWVEHINAGVLIAPGRDGVVLRTPRYRSCDPE
jgi:hypothetical protein